MMVSISENPNENPTSTMTDAEARKKTPVGWDQVVPCFKHSELWCVNNMAASVGCALPFPQAEVLPPDNGERFFSEYLTVTLPSLKGNKKPGELGECLCDCCSATSRDETVGVVAQTVTEKVTSTTATITAAINTTNNVNVRNRQQRSKPASKAHHPSRKCSLHCWPRQWHGCRCIHSHCTSLHSVAVPTSTLLQQQQHDGLGTMLPETC